MVPLTADFPISTTDDETMLAPFEIWEVMLDDSTIKFFEPFIVQPEVLPPEESGDPAYWTVDVPKLDLSAVGISLEELESCVRSDIRMTWKQVVRKHNKELTPHDRTIKQRWLEIAEEVCDE
jgi:hypothetical protein